MPLQSVVMNRDIIPCFFHCHAPGQDISKLCFCKRVRYFAVLLTSKENENKNDFLHQWRQGCTNHIFNTHCAKCWRLLLLLHGTLNTISMWASSTELAVCAHLFIFASQRKITFVLCEETICTNYRNSDEREWGNSSLPSCLEFHRIWHFSCEASWQV